MQYTKTCDTIKKKVGGNQMLEIRRCEKCGAVVKVLQDCTCENCGIQCCGDTMKEVIPNVVECVVEKHIPVYEKRGDTIFVKVNHVMEEKHYIQWISMVYDNIEIVKKLNPREEPVAEFPYVKGATVYEYCNIHGLWKTEVE